MDHGKGSGTLEEKLSLEVELKMTVKMDEGMLQQKRAGDQTSDGGRR